MNWQLLQRSIMLSLILIGLVSMIASIIVWQTDQRRTQEQTVEIDEQTARREALLANPIEKIVVSSTRDAIETLYVSSLQNPPTSEPVSSEVLPEPQLPYTARVTIHDGLPSIILYDPITDTESVIFTGEPTDQLSELSWSPDGTELAFINRHEQIISITSTGAELYPPINLPFTEFNDLDWIETNHLSSVITSSDENPAPFNPQMILIDRTGTIIERHVVFENIGIPEVVWSPDGHFFLFYDPWKNIFLIYDRFDQLRHAVTNTIPGKIVSLAWLAGTPSFRTDSTVIPEIDLEPPVAASTFVVTADQWEHYNTTMRTILDQFQTDFSHYRFEVTSDGIAVSFALKQEQKKRELVFIQTILQALTVLPEVPALSLALLNDGAVEISVENVSTRTAKAVAEYFTTQPFEDLFIINAKNPVGKVATKPDKPAHSYVGDVVYSNLGEYNPLPALALFGARWNNQNLLWREDYAVAYPELWQTKTVDGNQVFSTTETIFVSPTVWQGFSVVVRPYQLPDDISFEQWLAVNRSDRDLEDVLLPLHQPLVAKHSMNEEPYREEYDLYAYTTVYAVTMERREPLSDEDRTSLQKFIQSFSQLYAFSNR